MCWFHRWVAVSSGNYKATWAWSRDGGGTDLTLVLYRCTKCGAHKTESLTGLWTTEQLMIGVPTEGQLGLHG